MKKLYKLGWWDSWIVSVVGGMVVGFIIAVLLGWC